MQIVRIEIARVHPEGDGLPLPQYATPGSAGMDLVSAIDITVEPGAIRAVPTGLFIAVPSGYEGQIRARSGLASKGVLVPNAPGTLDSDYRGHVKVLLWNTTGQNVYFKRGDRIAQLVVTPVVQVAWDEKEALDSTERGAGGFGSTGV
jgi:dUTP pyrophosphatase